MKWVSVIVFSTTFILLLSEAIIHYNMGRPEKKFTWPSGKEMLHIFGIVSLYSLINAFLVWGIEKIFFKE